MEVPSPQKVAVPIVVPIPRCAGGRHRLNSAPTATIPPLRPTNRSSSSDVVFPRPNSAEACLCLCQYLFFAAWEDHSGEHASSSSCAGTEAPVWIGSRLISKGLGLCVLMALGVHH